MVTSWTSGWYVLDSGYVRAPGYIRGKAGAVAHISPVYPFHDAHDHGVASQEEHACDVGSHSTELWPDEAHTAFVHVGVF